MTAQFMADATVQETYGTSPYDVFEDTFSKVSVENIIFYIVASCVYVLEVLFDRHKQETIDMANKSIVATIPWYYAQALAFQYGESLVLDTERMMWQYATVNTSKQVVKYAAVKDRGTFIEMLVSGDKDGRPEVLSNDVRMAFEQYMNQIKIAGVVLKIRSREADKIQVQVNITRDRMVMNENGALLSAPLVKPVENAINDYLSGVTYGGVMNKTKLVDAIQNAQGVADVELIDVKYSTDGGKTYKSVVGNNYESFSGSFVSTGLENSIRYI